MIMRAARTALGCLTMHWRSCRSLQSLIAVSAAGRLRAGVQQVFIPEDRFAAARVDLFLHAGWPGERLISAGSARLFVLHCNFMLKG